MSTGAARAQQRRRSEHRVQYNYDIFAQEANRELTSLPLVTREQLLQSKERPRSCRMLARDFIHDSLYNPNYGYFSRQAVLLPEDDAAGRIDFNAIRNEGQFMRLIQQRYMAFERQQEEVRGAREKKGASDGQPTVQEQIDELARRERRAGWGSAESLELAREKGRLLQQQSESSMEDHEIDAMAASQVWHTPAQLFKPYYGRAIARYVVAEYKLNLFPHHELVLYELGGGSGTLAQDILDYIEKNEPDVYPQLRYRIVEISARLAKEQLERLARHRKQGTVEVVNKSILEWDEDVDEPCFVIALEVLDNLAHDVVRYSNADFTPYQDMVCIDHTGDIHELWEPVQDPLIERYLSLLNAVNHTRIPPGAASYLSWLPEPVRRALHEYMPFYPNLTQPFYVATGSLQLLDVLRRHFPLHRLIIADFSSLPDTVPGVNAPVVQTRHRGMMIPVTTFCTLQGFFDIFFPTDFYLLRSMYKRVMALPSHDEQPRGELLRAANASTESPLPDRYFSSSQVLPPTQPGAEDKQRWLHEDFSQVVERPTFLHSLFSSDIIPPPLLSSRPEARILSHADFLQRYAETDRTALADGTNPMITWYANACWFLT